ncbi:hypothetical protein [Haloprofundus salinisoli]|uniref:hypothetical protein n=1 Tax=Haloprofundus salinisoli TaxID=2876193 RepID=UPI001CCBC0B1|nr:hypothetical protein [Haloprofundus salinisoli]
MPYSSNDFMQQGAPVGEFFRSVNKGYELAYEWDRHDYHPRVEDRFGRPSASRSEFGLDLSRIRCNSGTWGTNLEDIQNHVLYHVVQNAKNNRITIESFFRDSIPQEKHDEIARNITNAWRDEFALNDPVEGVGEDRMRTTEWRIAQCYYAIFKAQSALMHANFDEIRSNDSGGSHVRMWKKHRREMMPQLGNSLYAYPFMFFPQATTGSDSSNWFDWTVPFPIPDQNFDRQEDILQQNARDSLENLYGQLEEFDWTNEGGLNTFYDALLMLRAWANYQHGGVFSRLYGEGYIQAIDEALRLLAFTGLAIAETGIILAHGWRRFLVIWQVFWANAYAGIANSYEIARRRLQVYREAFGD